MKADNSIYEAWNDISESQPHKTVEFYPGKAITQGKHKIFLNKQEGKCFL